MDRKVKREIQSFTKSSEIQDTFDETARKDIDYRCQLIREEYQRGETPIIEGSLEVPFTRKELENAMSKLKTKYFKSTVGGGIAHERDFF